MVLEEFVIKARLLIDDGGYKAAVKESTLRDRLVFWVKSDIVRKDSIALGNILTFKQVCDLSKVEENTKVQMEIISKDEDISDLHTVQRMHEQESPHSSQKFQKQGFKQRTFSNDQN